MERNNMYFETQRAKVYKNLYRPSANMYRFFKSILQVIVAGQPLSGNYHQLHKRRK